MRWLIDCEDVAIPELPEMPPIRSPKPLSADVPVEENGDPLVSVLEAVAVYPVYSWMGFEHVSSTVQVRADVLERLARASANLPSGFELTVIDGYRTRVFQAELMAYYKSQTQQSLDGYVSDPDSTTVIPPHVTGGAVDLTLSWRGAVLGLGTDFDDFTLRSAPGWFDGADRDGRVRALRRLLAGVLSAEGMVVIDTEWWHWSYGDQRWAVHADAPAACYGETSG